MMPAEALASCDIAWIFAFIFLRSRSTRDRLPSASARLPPAFCWIAIDDAEEIRLRHRHVLVELAAGLAQRHADRLGFDDGAEFGLHRLRRLGRDHLQAVEQRQAGLDAAHDDVDGVGEGVEEFRLAPLLQERQQPARQAEGAGKAERGGDEQAGADDQSRPGTSTTPMPRRDQQELPLRPVQAGLRDAHRERHVLALLVALLEFLERLLDDVAARLRLCRATRAPPAPPWRRSPCASRLAARPTGSDRRIPRPRRRPRRCQKEHGERVHGVLPRQAPPSLRWRLPRRRARRPGAAPRRSSGRGPRSAAGRCRSSGGGR